MKILVFNCGSSSLKYQLFDMENERVLAKGLVDKIGFPEALLTHKPDGGEKIVVELEIPTHVKAIQLVLAALTDQNYGVIAGISEINAIGHRIVHGGATYPYSVIVDDTVIAELKKISALAPLHNPPGVLGIEACKEIMPKVPMAVVFDTSFHQTMPPEAYIYALPYEYYEKYGLRRYGFHGTSHRFVSERVAVLLGKPLSELKLITCHLGNGSSITAIKGGKVIDTSMGFTPLGGLVMGTRCGDIDPAIIPFLMAAEDLDFAEINMIMNKKSGFLGISGISSDMRDIEIEAAKGHARAQLALDVFFHTLVKTIGGYISLMDGLDVIVFTAGIGENSPETREFICRHLAYLGLEFDAEANRVRGKERLISTPSSQVQAFLIPTNEELLIARDTKKLVEQEAR